ncbi:hypothetical protein BDR07DRAFT_1412029 [Suillus spraguei]|nr:hypothetical protein BDR07DRAFT_1412029 [Suillus spraguei]
MSWLGTLHVSNVPNGCYETFSDTGRFISGVNVLVRPNIFLHSTSFRLPVMENLRIPPLVGRCRHVKQSQKTVLRSHGDVELHGSGHELLEPAFSQLAFVLADHVTSRIPIQSLPT